MTFTDTRSEVNDAYFNIKALIFRFFIATTLIYKRTKILVKSQIYKRVDNES